MGLRLELLFRIFLYFLHLRKCILLWKINVFPQDSQHFPFLLLSPQKQSFLFNSKFLPSKPNTIRLRKALRQYHVKILLRSEICRSQMEECFVFSMISNENANIIYLNPCHHGLIFPRHPDPRRRGFVSSKFWINNQRPGNFSSSLSPHQYRISIIPDFCALNSSKAIPVFPSDPISQIRHFQDCLDIVLHAEFPEYRCFLGKVTDSHLCTLIHRQLGNIDIIQKNISIIRLD